MTRKDAILCMTVMAGLALLSMITSEKQPVLAHRESISPPELKTTTSGVPQPAPSTTTTTVQVRSVPPTSAPSTPTVTATVKSTATAQAEHSEPGSSLASCIRHYESTNGVHPNLYQFVPGTWRAAFQAAKDQGRIPTGTVLTSASNAPRAVQDAAFAAWVADGHLKQAWAAQAGRCFT